MLRSTSLASVVTGTLFPLAIFFSPIAGVIPSEATAPVLIVVGFLMLSIGGRRCGGQAGTTTRPRSLPSRSVPKWCDQSAAMAWAGTCPASPSG